jgi:hypothetical protein
VHSPLNGNPAAAIAVRPKQDINLRIIKMNIIRTVGDLVKALSAYDENVELNFTVDGEETVDAIRTDEQIYYLANRKMKCLKVNLAIITNNQK